MKYSGIPWIGHIPEHWEASKIGQLYDNRYERVSDKVFEPLSVTMQGVLPQLETAAKTDDGDNRKLIQKGDFAINSRSDRRGSCGILVNSQFKQGETVAISLDGNQSVKGESGKGGCNL